MKLLFLFCTLVIRRVFIHPRFEMFNLHNYCWVHFRPSAFPSATNPPMLEIIIHPFRCSLPTKFWGASLLACPGPPQSASSSSPSHSHSRAHTIMQPLPTCDCLESDINRVFRELVPPPWVSSWWWYHCQIRRGHCYNVILLLYTIGAV